MHETDVHFVSESVSCFGKQATNESEIKLTKRWIDFLEQDRESARITDVEQVQFRFRILVSKRT